VFSQELEKAKIDAKNEIKLNLLMSVLSFPDISFERIWGNNVGLGLSVGFPLESNDTHYRILPYGRFYFGESSTKSFFIEANIAVEGYKKDTYDSFYDDNGYNVSSKAENTTGFGLGVAYGYRYVNRNGLVGELYFGLGRDFDRENAYPRVGISIGKQF